MIQKNGLEEQADNDKTRDHYWKPLSWLGTLRTMNVYANDRLDQPLWENTRFEGYRAFLSPQTPSILLLDIISVKPSKQPLMVRTFLKVYMELGSYFLFLQEQIKDIIIKPTC